MLLMAKIGLSVAWVLMSLASVFGAKFSLAAGPTVRWLRLFFWDAGTGDFNDSKRCSKAAAMFQ